MITGALWGAVAFAIFFIICAAWVEHKHPLAKTKPQWAGALLFVAVGALIGHYL